MIALNNLPTERLSAEEEARLSVRIRKGPRKKAAVDRLVLYNLREATIYAKHYCPNDLFADGEILSLCYDVLKKSAPRFKPSYGIRFLAFTKHRLRGAMKRHCTTLDAVKHASMKRSDSGIGGPTFLPFTGGQDKICGKTGDEETCVLGGTTEFDFGGVDTREWRGPLRKAFKEKLNLRQRMILRLVYDLGFNMQEVGDMLAVSRSAVQMTHSSALTVLRREIGVDRELFSSE